MEGLTIDALKEEKIMYKVRQIHFSGRFQFGKLGSRTSESHFEELNGVF
jgi:hypothetical protein